MAPPKSSKSTKNTLATTSKPRGYYGWLQVATYIAIGSTAFYGMHVRPGKQGLWEYFESTMTKGVFPDDRKFALKSQYTGISGIDQFLTFAGAAFIPGITGWHKGFRMLEIYFLCTLIQPIAIFTVESCRKRNAWTLISFISVWSLLYQTTGIGIIMPLYYITYTFISRSEQYWQPSSREVPLHYAYAILPAILIAYPVPTLVMLFPSSSDPATIQSVAAIWQPAPLVVSLLTVVFAYVYKLIFSTKITSQAPGKASADVPVLKGIYATVFILGATVHITTVSSILLSSDPKLTLHGTFVPNLHVGKEPMGEALRNLWLSDFYGLFVSSLAWCVFAVWDLRRVGLTTVHMGKAFIALGLASVLVGPGAAMVGCWYWRESVMARMETKREKTR